MGGIPRTPPGERHERQEEEQEEQQQHGVSFTEGTQVRTPRVRKPKVFFSPSPPTSTMVRLGRPKFQRIVGQSQEFLNSPKLRAAGKVDRATPSRRPRKQPGVEGGLQEVQ